MLQQDQLKGMLDRVGLVLATWFLAYMVRKGWIGAEDSAVLLPGLILIPALIWGWWNNRNKALVHSAANVPGTVVVTSPELAAATPDQNNIVSNTNVVVKTR